MPPSSGSDISRPPGPRNTGSWTKWSPSRGSTARRRSASSAGASDLPLPAPAALLWEAAGRIGAQRLHPFVPELVDRLTQCGELSLAPEVEPLLRQASPAPLGRLLAPARALLPPRGATTTRPGPWLTPQIPLRTFAEWDDARPGCLEADLVAHCGTSTEGCSLCTLCALTAPAAPPSLPKGRGLAHASPPG